MITSVIPKLPFISKQETLDFYVELLDAALISDYGDYFIMEIGQAEVHFFHYARLEPGKSDFMVYLRIDHGIEQLYSKVQRHDFSQPVLDPLLLKPWKQMEFALTDPNGTLLTFGQQASTA